MPRLSPTCVGVRVMTKLREMERQSPLPYLARPMRNRLQGRQVAGARQGVSRSGRRQVRQQQEGGWQTDCTAHAQPSTGATQALSASRPLQWRWLTVQLQKQTACKGSAQQQRRQRTGAPPLSRGCPYAAPCPGSSPAAQQQWRRQQRAHSEKHAPSPFPCCPACWPEVGRALQALQALLGSRHCSAIQKAAANRLQPMRGAPSSAAAPPTAPLPAQGSWAAARAPCQWHAGRPAQRE